MVKQKFDLPDMGKVELIVSSSLGLHSQALTRSVRGRDHWWQEGGRGNGDGTSVRVRNSLGFVRL
jgi:hypothetical protein